MRSNTVKVIALVALVFCFCGCKKDLKTETHVDLIYSTDFTINTTGKPHWTQIETVVPVTTGIDAKLTEMGITADNVGSITQKNFVIGIKSPAGKKISDFLWLENYEMWMNVPNIDKVQSCNKAAYTSYLGNNSSWEGLTTWVTGTNYRSHVIENSYDLKLRYTLNDNAITTPTVVLTITQTFDVKAIKK